MISTAKNLSAKEWLHGLVSAIINGAAGAISVVIVDPVDFNLYDGREKLMMVATTMAIVALALYLKDKPLPDRLWDGTDRRQASNGKDAL